MDKICNSDTHTSQQKPVGPYVASGELQKGDDQPLPQQQTPHLPPIAELHPGDRVYVGTTYTNHRAGESKSHASHSESLFWLVVSR